ncbi:MAG: hypothetical protein DYG96_01205 [Chlorobi bacterium CHB2]|nr:hypothetical protein [Chlorobi bacterium CHB2]
MAHLTRNSAAALGIAVLFAACAPRPIQLTTPCASKSTKEIVAALSALVMAEGMQLTLVNDNIGILQASTAEDHSIWTGIYSTKQWVFTMKSDTVLAYAKTVDQSRNAFGAVLSTSETYYSDKVHPDHAWYWNVRRGLETLCGGKVEFVQK